MKEEEGKTSHIAWPWRKGKAKAKAEAEAEAASDICLHTGEENQEPTFDEKVYMNVSLLF